MISLEQVKLLETKVAKAIEYVEKVTGENAALRAKLEANQKRIDELEVLVLTFKEDQGRIEDAILAALDRLNQFEDAIEESIAGHQGEKSGKPQQGRPAVQDKQAVQDKPVQDKVMQEKSAAQKPEKSRKIEAEKTVAPAADINDPLGASEPENGELDIF